MASDVVHDSHPAGHEHPEHQHPSWKTYLVIAIILTVITAVEVAIFYIPALGGILIPALLTLSAAKFILVVMFYMHLKFDSSLFSGVFLAPLSLALAVVVSLILLFRVLPLIPWGS